MKQDMRHVEKRPFEELEIPYLAGSLESLECLEPDCPSSGWFVSDTPDYALYVSGGEGDVYITPKIKGVDLHAIPKSLGMELRKEGSISFFYGNGNFTGKEANALVEDILGSPADEVRVNGTIIDRLIPEESYIGKRISAHHADGMRVSIERNDGPAYLPKYKIDFYNIKGAGREFDTLKEEVILMIR